MQRPHEIEEVAARKCVWASRGNHAVEQFGESVKYGSEKGANEADDGSSSGPVLLPLGEDVGSRWPSEAGHGPWIATAESADDALLLPLMDLEGGGSQGSKDGRIRECGVQHLAVHSGAIERESGVRMVFAMADKGLQSC